MILCGGLFSFAEVGAVLLEDSVEEDERDCKAENDVEDIADAVERGEVKDLDAKHREDADLVDRVEVLVLKRHNRDNDVDDRANQGQNDGYVSERGNLGGELAGFDHSVNKLGKRNKDEESECRDEEPKYRQNNVEYRRNLEQG